MKTFPSFVAGTLLACLALLSQAAPADEGYGPKNKQVIACVRKALKGDKIDYRVVTQQSDTYAAASKGDILYVFSSRRLNVMTDFHPGLTKRLSSLRTSYRQTRSALSSSVESRMATRSLLALVVISMHSPTADCMIVLMKS